jgi:HK97 gp10 family phage protein
VRTVKLTGFRGTEAALAELPKATGKNVLRRVGKGALEPMAAAAAAKAPARSGKLAYSIVVSEKRTSRAKKSTTRFIKGKFRASASTGVEIAMGPGSGLGTLYYATFDEFGTVDTPAFGFMRAAWDGGSGKALDYIKDRLWSEVERSAAKQARKRAKAAA